MSAGGLGEVRLARVRGEAVLVATGLLLVAAAMALPALMGARVVWLPLKVRVPLAAGLVVVGGVLVYLGLSRIARKTGWTMLLEGFGAWLLSSLVAAVLFAHSGWASTLQWVGLASTEADEVSVILYSVLATIIGVLFLFTAAASLAPSMHLARNLFRASPLIDHAVFVYKLASVLSIIVYPLAAVAAALASIGLALAASEGRVAVRAAVAGSE